MAIYAWPGLEVEITEARFAPVWIEERRAEIRRHMTEPKPNKRTRKLTQDVAWLVKMKAVEKGDMLRGGKWDNLHTLRANEGIQELVAKFETLVGADEMAKFTRWRESTELPATELWSLIPAKEVA